MRIQIFCFSLLLMINGIVYAAVPIGTPKVEAKKEEPKSAPEDFSSLAGQPDNVLAEIASHLSNADLARFQLVSRKFRAIGQAEFERRLGATGYLWAKGEIIPNQFHAHEGLVNSVFVANNGNIVSVGRTDHHISVWKWDGTAYKKIRQMTDDVDYNDYFILHAEFSPVENRLVLLHSNNLINVWDIQEGKKIKQFDIGDVGKVRLSPDGTTLAARRFATDDIELWDVVKGTKTKQITAAMTGYHGGIYSLAFSTDGKKLASSSQGKEPVCIWNVETLAQENKFTFNQNWANLLFLSGNKLIADTTGYELGGSPVELIWDVETDKLIAKLGLKGPEFVVALAFTHDGSLVAEGTEQGSLPVWYIRAKEIVRKLNIEGFILSLKFSPDDKMLVAGCENGDIVTWKAQPKKKEAKSTK